MSFSILSMGNQRPADQSDDQCSCSGGRSGSENGKGYISVLGMKNHSRIRLQDWPAEGFIRRSLAKSVNLRNTPRSNLY